jgi:DNA-binding MarR family transcriptional regulator
VTDAHSQPKPLAARPGFLFAQMGFHVTARCTELLKPLGIGPRHFGMLKLLSEHDGMSQQQLAEELVVHRNVMVGLVDELERRELVQRRRHPTDRRAHAVHLLPAGRRLLAHAERVVDGFEAELLAPLAEGERRTAMALLQRISLGAGRYPGTRCAWTDAARASRRR